MLAIRKKDEARMSERHWSIFDWVELVSSPGRAWYEAAENDILGTQFFGAS